MTRRILVVEDQEDLRGLLRTLLTGSGYEVLEAANGEAGVAKAKSDRPDLVLMDIVATRFPGSLSAFRTRAAHVVALGVIGAGESLKSGFGHRSKMPAHARE